MEHINNDHSQNGGIAYEYQINRTRKSPGTDNARRKQSSHHLQTKFQRIHPDPCRRKRKNPLTGKDHNRRKQILQSGVITRGGGESYPLLSPHSFIYIPYSSLLYHQYRNLKPYYNIEYNPLRHH